MAESGSETETQIDELATEDELKELAELAKNDPATARLAAFVTLQMQYIGLDTAIKKLDERAMAAPEEREWIDTLIGDLELKKAPIINRMNQLTNQTSITAPTVEDMKKIRNSVIALGDFNAEAQAAQAIFEAAVEIAEGAVGHMSG